MYRCAHAGYRYYGYAAGIDRRDLQIASRNVDGVGTLKVNIGKPE